MNLYIFSYFLLIMYYYVMESFGQINFNYFSSSKINSIIYNFSFSMDYTNIFFLTMVVPVTLFVLKFSETYMEHYNNKKFIFLLLMFFFSMFMLITSGSMINFMMGWDGLGLSSICLIMFYPNKNSLYNSILTMFFNRIGDVMMILSLSILISNYSELMILMMESKLMSVIFLICAFSKSAQFPLSSWLPAAMSAPTPISAMVHSSTLVTAGVLLIDKIYFFVMENNSFVIILMFSSLTFLMGGFMANTEADMKKMVAFSTMSQISMMIFFCMTIGMWASMLHMIFHAFFKTLLFCCCGLIFFMKFSSQIKVILKNYSFNSSLAAFFFLSIFSMTGLIFSSSFFSKDEFLEMYMSMTHNLNFFVMMTGSILTLFYCSSLMGSVSSWSSNNSASYYYKNYPKKMFCFFSILTFFIVMIVKKMILMENFVHVSFLEVILILVLFLMPFFLKMKKSKSFLSLTMSISLMKEFSYTLKSKIFSKKMIYNFSITELTLFKPQLFKKMKEFKDLNFFSFSIIYVLVTLIMISA